jgi:muconolactone delta-isomerase
MSKLPEMKREPNESDARLPECELRAATEDTTRDLHVKGVPEHVWRRARCNATNSGMTFKDYMIATLESCEPICGH